MHELGITSEVLRAVLDAAEREGATRVNVVKVSVGELTEVVPDAMRFAWESVREGTMASEALLEIRMVPARSRCLECGTVFEHDRFDRRCAECRSFIVETLEGGELLIDSVDVDLAE